MLRRCTAGSNPKSPSDLVQFLDIVALPDHSALQDAAKHPPSSRTAATSSSSSMGKPRFGARKSRNTRGMGLVSCRLYAANRCTDVFAIVHAVKMNLLRGLISQ